MLEELKKKVVMSYNKWKERLRSKEVHITLWQDGSVEGCISTDYENFSQRQAFVMALTMAQLIGKPVGFETSMVHWFARLRDPFGDVDPMRLYSVISIIFVNTGIMLQLEDRITGKNVTYSIPNDTLDQYFDANLV